MSYEPPVVRVDKNQLEKLTEIFGISSLTFEGVEQNYLIAIAQSDQGGVIFMEKDAYYLCYPNKKPPTA